MTCFAGRRIWIVGASEGLGAALACGLSKADAHLILSARNRARLTEVATGLAGPSSVLPMDVSSRASVAAAAKEAGAVDILIFAAGVYWPMAAQTWDAEAAEHMADVNFTGAVRVLGQVVPSMVARDAGQIMLIGSLAGFRGLPGAIGYSASKAGVRALAESLQADLWRSNVRVQLANPGFIKTRLTDKNEFRMPGLMTPEVAADHVIRQLETPGRFAGHFPAAFALVFRLSRFLPLWAYNRLFA